MGRQLTSLQKSNFVIKMHHFKRLSFPVIKHCLNKYFAHCENADAKEIWQDCVKPVMKDNCEALIVSDLNVQNLWRLGSIVSSLLSLANHVDDEGIALLSRVFRQYLRIPLLNILRLWLRVDDKRDSPDFYMRQLQEAAAVGEVRSATGVYINIATIVSSMGHFEAKHFQKPVPRFCSCVDLIDKYKKDWCSHKGTHHSVSRLGARAEDEGAMELSPMKSLATREGAATPASIIAAAQFAVH